MPSVADGIFVLTKLIFLKVETVDKSSLQKRPLPNATAVLVLGILSLIFWCFIGLVLGIIGLVISKEGKELYDKDPQDYTSYGSLNAGRVLCIIGIVLNGIGMAVLLIWIFVIAGIAGSFAGFHGF